MSEAERPDRVIRGRATAVGGSTFGRDGSMMQKLADRMMSDASREMASDLTVRALGQSIFSALCLFFAGLALRNYFKLR